MIAAATTRSPAPAVAFAETIRPTVSFVSVTYGTGPIVVDSLASLRASIDADDIDIECVVVDNPHPDAPGRARRELLLGTAGVRLLSPDRNLGFGGGCELGAFHACGDVLAFVNPDVMYEPGWLPPLIGGLEDPSVSIIAPVLLEADRSVQEAGQHLFADGNTMPHTTAPAVDEDITVEYASAACWLMRRDEHERLGGFDAAYHPAYYEDVDLALRARRHGGRCVVTGRSTVVHLRGSSTADRRAPDISAQRSTLLDRWPELRWRQPKSEPTIRSA